MTTRKGPSGGGSNKRPPAGDRDITQVRIIRIPRVDVDLTEELPGDRDIGDYDKITPGDLPGDRDIGDH
jgi:hypothetical protein